MLKRSHLLTSLSGLLIFALQPLSLPASQQPEQQHTVTAQIAGYFPTAASSMQFNNSAAIDLEDDMALSQRDIAPLLSVHYHFTPIHKISFSYHAISRTGTVDSLGRDLEMDNVTFARGTRVESSLTTRIARIAYGWQFYRQPDTQVTLHGGLHLTHLAVESENKITPFTTAFDQQQRVSMTAPLPSVGLSGRYAWRPQVSLDGDAHLLYFTDGKTSGAISSLLLQATWHPKPEFDVNLGYSLLSISASGSEPGFTELGYLYHGPLLGLTLLY